MHVQQTQACSQATCCVASGELLRGCRGSWLLDLSCCGLGSLQLLWSSNHLQPRASSWVLLGEVDAEESEYYDQISYEARLIREVSSSMTKVMAGDWQGSFPQAGICKER